MKTFHKGGIHPPADKLTADKPITALPRPRELNIMLGQCIGAPSKPVVKAGDEVVAGQLLAEAGGFVGAPIHAPLAGKVKKLDKVRDPQGFFRDAIIIEVADEQAAPVSVGGACQGGKEIVARVGDCGIVGLGGATFPTRVKLSPPEGKTPRFIILNGAECEPFLTCDDLLMQTQAKGIARGGALLMESVGVDKCYIGIEENKPKAIHALREATQGDARFEVVVLKKKYPQGGEKQLIAAITGLQVPDGGLPVEVGAIVDNVATAYAVAQACDEGLPLTQRIVTVTGPSLSAPGNFLVPFGTPISELIAFAGGLPEDTGKVIAGGPMMGRAVSCLDAPTTKGLSGLTILPRSESLRGVEGPCIRCASCVEACPMGLEPYLLMAQALCQEWEGMRERHAMSCIECGSCSYVCPTSRPILDYIKLGKIQLRKK